MIGIGAIANLADTVVKRVWPDASEADKARLELFKQELALSIAQLDVNKTEAANESIFVSGWRPGVGWVCSSALAWNFVIQPLIVALCATLGSPIHPADLVTLDLSVLMPLLLGILGLGGMRSFEKLNDVNRRR